MLGQRGLLYIGDRKMGAKTTRAQIAAKEDFYLVPLSNPGEVPHLLAECVDSVVDGDRPATLIFNKTSDSETPQLVSAGYETHREQSHTLAGGQPYSWKERVLVIRSHQTALKQIATLEHRLNQATDALLALTPPKGRGKRQIRTEAELRKKADGLCTRFGVSEFLSYMFRREEQKADRYIGPGRGGEHRQKRTVTTVRYQITDVIRDEVVIAAASHRMGWRLFVTNLAADQLSMWPTNLDI